MRRNPYQRISCYDCRSLLKQDTIQSHFGNEKEREKNNKSLKERF